MFLICENSARSRPCDGLVDLKALSALPRSARCLYGFHFVSLTTCTSSKNIRSRRSFGPISSMSSWAIARASPKRLPIALDESTATSHAVPTFGWFWALPHCVLSANFVGWSSPETCTRKWAFCSGNGKVSKRFPGFSICSLQQFIVVAPVTPAQGCSTSLRRLNWTTSMTVVRRGLPPVNPAVGSMRRMCASGAAPASLASQQRGNRTQRNRTKKRRRAIASGPRQEGTTGEIVAQKRPMTFTIVV